MTDVLVILMFVNLLTLTALTVVNGSANKYARSGYETVDAIIANGYPAERHKVVTDDGYVLQLHRIPSTQSRPIVLMMHGLLASSNYFISLGPEFGVAYNYADAGFDVWMGNARGTRNSRKHTSLNPNDVQERLKFFDFSFEEIGRYDVAAFVEYILKVTKQDKLHYIGHSQGSTVFLVLNSMRPEFNNKFKSAHLMSPVGYQNHFPDKAMAALCMTTDVLYYWLISKGVVELFPPTPNGINRHTTVDDTLELCAGDVSTKFLCNVFQYIFDKIDGNPSFKIGGAALKQLAHFGQNVRDQAFRRWNYGTYLNVQKYHEESPPIYDLKLITTNVTMHYAVADNKLDEKDVLAMADIMPNARVRQVTKEDFLHSDFVTSRDAKKLVTSYIINDILTLEQWLTANNG